MLIPVLDQGQSNQGSPILARLSSLRVHLSVFKLIVKWSWFFLLRIILLSVMFKQSPALYLWSSGSALYDASGSIQCEMILHNRENSWWIENNIIFYSCITYKIVYSFIALHTRMSRIKDPSNPFKMSSSQSCNPVGIEPLFQ